MLFASSGFGGPNPDSLFTVDPSTGAATLVGVIGVTTPRGQSGGVTDLGIGNDGTIFGTMLDALISIDPGTGQGSLVGSYVNNTGIEAIDVDPTTGILYGIDLRDGDYFSIDTLTGLAALLGSYGRTGGRGNWSGLGIDNSGDVYASTGEGFGDIYQLNPDFSLTLLGSHDGSVSDITFGPEASRAAGTLAMFAIGLAGLGFMRRRKTV